MFTEYVEENPGDKSYSSQKGLPGYLDMLAGGPPNNATVDNPEYFTNMENNNAFPLQPHNATTNSPRQLGPNKHAPPQMQKVKAPSEYINNAPPSAPTANQKPVLFVNPGAESTV